MASQAECETCFQANVLIFTLIFKLTPLLKRCCLKVLLEKTIQSRRFCQHCQILAFVLLRSFRFFVAPETLHVSTSR